MSTRTQTRVRAASAALARSGAALGRSAAGRACSAALLACSAALAAPLHAQSGEVAELPFGPHGVGFAVIEALDSTRAFLPQRDARGALAVETARPVQISVWYPAAPDPGALRMTAGEFRLLSESEVDFDAEPSAAEATRLRSEFVESGVELGRERAAAELLWDDFTPAVRDAPPLPGLRAAVLYFTAAGVSNATLPAYLASHGLVVASFPSNGRMTGVSLQFSPNALTLDTDVDDAGFVHAVLRRLPYADASRLAVVSFSSGSLAALLWAMRDMQPAAIVAIEGWERYRRGADIVTASPLYDPHRLRAPFLMIERAADEESAAYAKVGDVVGALPYAEITRVAFRDAAHGDFLSHAPFGHTADQPRILATSARMVRLFLEATLRDDGAAADSFAALVPPAEDAFFTVTRDPAVGPVPTEEELFRLAETDPEALADAYRDAAEVVPGRQLFREAVLTRAAMFADSPEDRAAIMTVVTAAYPGSTGAAFRLGQALAESGRTEEAAAEYRRALEAVGSDPALEEGERDGWRERIGKALDDLGV